MNHRVEDWRLYKRQENEMVPLFGGGRTELQVLFDLPAYHQSIFLLRFGFP